MKKHKFVKNLTKTLTFCLCCIFCIGVLFIIPLTVYGADEPSEGGGSSRITDLTGYTVTVPSGWSANSGFGQFDVVGTLYTIGASVSSPYYVNGFNIGYSWTGDGDRFWLNAESNAICDNTSLYLLIRSYSSFEFTITGGTDVTNPSLIDWLYNNNATFVNNNAPALSTFKIFNPATEQFTAEYQYEEGMTFADWVNSEYNVDNYSIVTGVREPQLGHNDNIKDYVVSAVTDTTDIYFDVRYLMTTAGEVILADTLVQPINYMLGVQRLFKPCYSLGYDDGYIAGDEAGYHTGYDMGFADGLHQGQSSAIGENLIGSGFTAITDSLNHIILYQSSTGAVVTLWVVICGVIGIALFIWILKLFAGG